MVSETASDLFDDVPLVMNPIHFLLFFIQNNNNNMNATCLNCGSGGQLV